MQRIIKPNKFKTATYAIYNAIFSPRNITKPDAYFRFQSSQYAWGSSVKKYNKRNNKHKAYYKANKDGVVIEAAFKEASNWWIVFIRQTPPKDAVVIDKSFEQINI